MNNNYYRYRNNNSNFRMPLQQLLLLLLAAVVVAAAVLTAGSNACTIISRQHGTSSSLDAASPNNIVALFRRNQKRHASHHHHQLAASVSTLCSSSSCSRHSAPVWNYGLVPRGGGGGGGDAATTTSTTRASSSSPPPMAVEAAAAAAAAVPTAAATTVTLRVRLPDGSLQKIQIAADRLSTETLRDALAPLMLQHGMEEEDVSVSLSSSSLSAAAAAAAAGGATADFSHTLAELGLQHGSLLTLTSTKQKAAAAAAADGTASARKKHGGGGDRVLFHRENTNRRFDPFPDLAKDYDAAVRRANLRRNAGSGMSYAAVASLQAALHTVDPQPQGKIQRMYMCRTAAALFHANGMDENNSNNSKDDSNNNDTPTDTHHRVGLLLGTVTRERKDAKPRARTSLSSTIDGDQYCQAARVHAVWEPPASALKKSQRMKKMKEQTTTTTEDENDAARALLLLNLQQQQQHSSVMRVTGYLGLEPVGWIFAYSEDRSVDGTYNNDGGNSLPVFGRDIQTGATLQIELMKQRAAAAKDEKDSGPIAARFVTLAMDSRTGATEAFQLSDVAVQMVAEDMFVFGAAAAGAEKSKTAQKKKKASGRYVTTRHPVLVDGKETRDLDSVLCLVNTALLSHTGMYAGTATASSIKKKNGALTKKARKAILKGLGENRDDSNDTVLLKVLCDFSLLLALDELLSEAESEQLCKTVQKWARGQKKSVAVDDKLKQRLKQVLQSAG